MMKKFIVTSVVYMAIISCSVKGNKKITFTNLMVQNPVVEVMHVKGKTSEAITLTDGTVLETGSNEEIFRLENENSRTIDAKGKTVFPMLIDSPLHLSRERRFFPSESYWNGGKSLKKVFRMLKNQDFRTTGGHWVGVMGSLSPFQFEERRFPTPVELMKQPEMCQLRFFLLWQNMT